MSEASRCSYNREPKKQCPILFIKKIALLLLFFELMVIPSSIYASWGYFPPTSTGFDYVAPGNTSCGFWGPFSHYTFPGNSNNGHYLYGCEIHTYNEPIYNYDTCAGYDPPVGVTNRNGSAIEFVDMLTIPYSCNSCCSIYTFNWLHDETVGYTYIYEILGEWCTTPGQMRSCYNGPTGTAGIGTCQYGTETCTTRNVWSSCIGEVLPQQEICDGLDNDCNAIVDNGFECMIGQTRLCYSGPAGTDGVGICLGGTQTCNSCQWDTACQGEVLPEAEICDETDNDCNGIVDNGFECMIGQTRSCYDGLAGTEGIGICRGGTQACNSCQWDTLCQGQILPGQERCDGRDGNCDGESNCECDESGQNTTWW